MPAASRWSQQPLRCGTPSISAGQLDAARRRGDLIPNALLAHLAPLGWQHINLTGDYLWGADGNLSPDGFKPLHGMVTEWLAAMAA